MKYVVKVIGREGGREILEWEIDEVDLSLAVGTRKLFEMQAITERGHKRVTITATVEKI